MDTFTLTSIREDIAKNIYDLYRNRSQDPDMYYCRKAVTSCISAKQDLINLLSKHPNWDERNLRVHFSADYARPRNVSAATIYLRELCNAAKRVLIRAIQEEPDTEPMSPASELYFLISVLYNYAWDFSQYTQINEFLVAPVKRSCPDARIHEGQKTTRAVIRMLRQYKYEELLKGEDVHDVVNPVTGEVKQVDALDRVNVAYTNYADAMNELYVKRHTVISVNPADFLRMSWGNSWNSCHYIDSGIPDDDGCYSGGCWSYAYDRQTMIYYTCEADVESCDITEAGKVTRQLYFWNGNTLQGSRCYPEKDDYDAPAYADNRRIMQQVIADCVGCGNLWRPVSGITYSDDGFHYPDYKYHTYPAWELSFNQTGMGPYEAKHFEIGSSAPICVCCGRPLDDGESSTCSICAGKGEPCDQCGDRYDRDDMTWVPSMNVSLCPHCLSNRCVWDDYNDEYIDSDDAVYVKGFGWVDESTIDSDSPFFYCDHCGNWYYNRDHEEHEADGYCICESCYEEIQE